MISGVPRNDGRERGRHNGAVLRVLHCTDPRQGRVSAVLQPQGAQDRPDTLQRCEYYFFWEYIVLSYQIVLKKYIFKI